VPDVTLDQVRDQVEQLEHRFEENFSRIETKLDRRDMTLFGADMTGGLVASVNELKTQRNTIVALLSVTIKAAGSALVKAFFFR
jgi:hypothetical protein